jgi:hypothetical protein
MTALAEGFDPDSLTFSEARAFVRDCTQIEASVSSMKALAAARVAKQNAWKADGYRSAADQLAHEAGMSPTNARRTLATGRRLAGQPEVAKAALAGELSPEQAALVAEGAAANPAKARDLIEQATQVSLPELADAVALAKAAVTDLEDRRRRIHAKRSFRRWTDRDGAFHAHLFGSPDDGVGLWNVIDPVRRRLIMLRRDRPERENLDTLDYDALTIIAAIAAGHDDRELRLADLLDLGLFPDLTTPTTAASTPPASPRPPLFESDLPDGAASAPPNSTQQTVSSPTPPDTATRHGQREPSAQRAEGPPPPTATDDERPADPGPGSPRSKRTKKLAGSPPRIMIRVDLDALLRGVPIEGELCEIAGYGPVPVSVIESLAAQGNTFIVGVLTKHHQIQGIYHQRRRPNAHQRSALDFLYPTCAVKGCNARAGLQSDHRIDWAKTRFTVYDLLDRLCAHHHRLKTQDNWALIAGAGKRHFVPPHDPRHPDYARLPRAQGWPS